MVNKRVYLVNFISLNNLQNHYSDSKYQCGKGLDLIQQNQGELMFVLNSVNMG